MRRFHSYGPVSSKRHFCVARNNLIKQCTEQLVGDPQEGGHYFTIWAPRQNGKTWLMRQVMSEIQQNYGDQFAVFNFSLGNLRGVNRLSSREIETLEFPPTLSYILEDSLPGHPQVSQWKDFSRLFSKEKGLWDRPLILLIDEADTAPPALLDWLVGQFREMYLNRELNWLHGLALIGVRAVLGMESERGSPFNIQRSLHVPNLTRNEVVDMYRQYQDESGQSILPDVVEAVYTETDGQPGLVSWFGELLTEKYNTAPDRTIDRRCWLMVHSMAQSREPNNTLLNMIAKARDLKYQEFLTELFTRSDIPFYFHNPTHNHLYLNGIIAPQMICDDQRRYRDIARFSAPFVQRCLYQALSDELLQPGYGVLALQPDDELTDVFASETLNLPALLERYKDYLKRLKAKGVNPWKAQPRRKTDFHLTEAVGHFHLYAWLKEAIEDECVISPEFPTGNGKVDLHLRCGDAFSDRLKTGWQGIIEVKSFKNATRLKKDKVRAAEYAKELKIDSVTMAIFIPLEDESVPDGISGADTIKDVRVNVVAIGWV